MKFEQFKIEILTQPDDPWEVGTSPELWTRQVADMIRKLETVDCGLRFLRLIGNGPKWIVIEPLLKNMKNCNAHGGARMTMGPNVGGVVKYDPEVFEIGGPCHLSKFGDSKERPPGSRGDEVFFHELVHAHRAVQGIRDPEKLEKGMYRYTSIEEFLAVVMTNVYIADITNKPGRFLRGGHHGHAVLEPVLSGSVAFYRSSPQVLPIMKKIQAEEPDLFASMASVRAWFNPFWSLLHQPAEVFSASVSEEARWYEKNNEKIQKRLNEQMFAKRRGYAEKLAKDRVDASIAFVISSISDALR